MEIKEISMYQLWEDDSNVKRDIERLREKEMQLIKKYLNENKENKTK